MKISRRDSLRLSVLAGAASSVLSAQPEGRPLEKPIEIRCAGLSFLFDPVLGFVRHVKWNGIEVLNGIYAAVRDETWGTVAARISNVIVETEVDAFKIVFDAVCKQGAIEYWWHGSIIGAPRALTFEMEGEAKTTFKKNRLGFCVLHPVGLGAVKIDHVDGKSEGGVFPLEVSPQQPFKNIKTIVHEVYPGLNAEVRFAGDTFEMEDHRNWTDNNFKTYCTPLADPFPVEVKQGQKLVQSVALRLAGTPKPLPKAWSKPAKCFVTLAGGPRVKLSSIGLGLALDSKALTPRQAARVRMLRPAHLRADLHKDTIDATLLRVAAELKLLPGVALEAALFVNTQEDADAMSKSILASRIPVARYILLQDVPRFMHLPKGAPIGIGTNQNFAELNRGRPDARTVDFLAYPIQPQVHAFDDMSILENAFGQGATVRTALQFGNGKPVVVSPVTLKTRPNADARQSSLLAAAWTVASVKSLVEGGASSVTYFETHGAGGLMDDDVYPLFHVFASLVGYQTVEPLVSEDVAALLLRDAKANARLILANLTNEVRVVDFRALKLPELIRAQILDSESISRFGRMPEEFQTTSAWQLRGSRQEIALMPYAVAVLTA